MELKKKLEGQDYLCPYTGRKLIPGVNASLDHVLPKSRFPELRCEIDNVEWIDLSVNYSKRDMTKDEYIAHCKHIVDYTNSKRLKIVEPIEDEKIYSLNT
jgi:hypothetical protein